jgi:hypothetical protein
MQIQSMVVGRQQAGCVHQALGNARYREQLLAWKQEEQQQSSMCKV